MNRIPLFRRVAGAFLLGASVAIIPAPQAHAQSGYASVWNGLYPDSTSESNAGCQLCHAASTQNLNPYGEAICSSNAGSISNRIQAVENADSDADPTGSDNITEIADNPATESSQPGWTAAGAVPTYQRGNCQATGSFESAPGGVTGLLDPAAANLPPVSDPNGPYTSTVGVPVVFDGSGSSDPDGTIVSYDWDFGDGNTGSGVSPSYTYAGDGIFTVNLTVTDDAGATNSATTTATITLPANLPPVADPNGPYTGTVGVAVNFDGTGSSDPDGTIVAYDWDFGDGNTGTGVAPSHAYAANGSYTVTLTVTDDVGVSDTAMTTADISDVPQQPPVSDPNGPYSGTVGVALTFDGTGSSDPDGTIVTYEWDFGDGSTGTGVSPSYSYSAAGNYTVSLTVTDDSGLSDTAASTADIAAGPQPPVSDPNGPYSGTVGVALAFDGSGSSDPDGTIVTYEWDFGDGSTGTGVSPTHSYGSVGSFTVTLTVTDDSGLSDTATSTADISDVPQQAPVADPDGPYTGTVGDPVTFDGSGSSDPDGTVVAYDWDFGDGNTGTGVSPTHSYSSVGSYTVTLTVTDDSGLSDTAASTADIAAGPQPPVADPNGPYTGTVGSAVQFDGTGSFDPDGGAIVSYAWDFGDGTSGSGATPTHSYATAGTYSVSLTVTDDEGVTDTGTTSAAIAELGPVDLDISKFKVSKNVNLGKKAVRIDLTVRNAGDVDESAQAVVTGVQNGVTVYSQAKDVSDAPGNGHTKWAFPGYTPTATGHIDWTATIADGDPDDDTATATTTVR